MKRSPAAAFWLSVLPGLGHLYLGQMAKGLALALLAVGLIDLVDRGADSFGILIPVYWLFVMIDAHRGAQEQNRAIEAGSPIREERLWGSAWWGWALVGLGVLFLLDNVGIRVFDWLWRFWPVILIVLGVRLIRQRPVIPDRSATPGPPPPPAQPEAGKESLTSDRGTPAETEEPADKGEKQNGPDVAS